MSNYQRIKDTLISIFQILFILMIKYKYYLSLKLRDFIIQVLYLALIHELTSNI